MKLYLISQSQNDGYDTYSDAVVCANNKEDAKIIHPDGKIFDTKTKGFRSEYDLKKIKEGKEVYDDNSWTNDLSKINVIYIGQAKKGLKRGVICASFHAG